MSSARCSAFFRFQGEENPIVPHSRILARVVAAIPPEVATHLALAAGSYAINLRRLRLVEGRPLLIETIWLPYEQFAPLADIPLERFGDLLYPMYQAFCGFEIDRAQEVIKIDQADPTSARLLSVPRASPIVIIDRVAFDIDGKPGEWRRSRGRADRFQYTTEIR